MCLNNDDIQEELRDENLFFHRRGFSARELIFKKKLLNVSFIHLKCIISAGDSKYL